ncbi:hypothetical protein ACFT7S_22160 [Streptomyces sp. NPDC057136]|uniref:hypothetical protein n=1 Tax=Streptomyces sp. NPDC057136 TaxID=3346029 RepID=UPI00363ADDE8
MGSSYAFPILAVSNAAEALRVAQHMLLLSEDRRYTTVDGGALARNAADVQRLAAVVPDGSVYLMEEVPLSVEVPEFTAEGTFEEEFVEALGDTPAWLRWDVGSWPAGPFGYGDTEYSGVQIAFNSRDMYFAPPPDGAKPHMLYVCVGMSDLKRAQWLAEQVGLNVLGEPIQSL